MSRTPPVIDVLILGAGPAGMTAATYLRRFHRSCVVLDGGASRARWIPESNNCPGFPGGVSGSALLQRMRRQADDVGVRFVRARAERIEATADGFRVRTGDGDHRTRKLIFATGVVDRLPALDGVADAIAAGALRLCAICDAYEATDVRIGVHGPAAAIAGHARFLRTYARDVVALPTDDGDGGDAGMDARTAGVRWLRGGGRLGFDGVRCHYTPPDGEPIAFDALYTYLGTDSAAAMAVAAGATTDETGGIVVDAHQQTAVPGLYAIGDVVGGLNQIAVAVGHAAVAATHAHGALPFAPRGEAGD
jgi:thioredoxin reductase (NADPH)